MTQHEAPSRDQVEAAARQLIEARMQSVRALADTETELAELARRKAEVEATKAQRWAAAVREGWTEPELRKLGFAAPGKQAPGRPRGKVRRRPSAAEVEQSGAAGLVAATLQREAEASVALDRDQTHAVG